MSASLNSLPNDHRVRVLIVDDHQPIRRLVRIILEAEPRFEVCGEAANGQQAIDAARELSPDVVLMNINMPVLGGLAAARKIKAFAPRIAIVILSSEIDSHFIEEAKKVGARDTWLKQKPKKGYSRLSIPRWYPTPTSYW